jgi:hypothetical protein
MEWWIVGALGVAVVVLISVYRIALRANRALTNLALLILLDPEVHEKQRASLAEFVRTTDAKSASDLGIRAALAMQSLAIKSHDRMLGVYELLWQLKDRRAVGWGKDWEGPWRRYPAPDSCNLLLRQPDLCPSRLVRFDLRGSF